MDHQIHVGLLLYDAGWLYLFAGWSLHHYVSTFLFRHKLAPLRHRHIGHWWFTCLSFSPILSSTFFSSKSGGVGHRGHLSKSLWIPVYHWRFSGIRSGYHNGKEMHTVHISAFIRQQATAWVGLIFLLSVLVSLEEEDFFFKYTFFLLFFWHFGSHDAWDGKGWILYGVPFSGIFYFFWP